MGLGRLDILRSWIDAGDRGPEPCQWFGNEAAAAADIEHREASQALRLRLVVAEAPAELVADISEALAGDAMERLEGSVGIPPAGRVLGETRDLVAVERG